MTYDVLPEAEEEKPWKAQWRWRDRTPVDEVSPQHEAVHALLIRWGLWNSGRSRGNKLASAESLYCKVAMAPSTAPLGSDPSLMAVERAVIRMPLPHRRTMCMLYVYRWTPHTVCRQIRPGLRFEAWAEWVHTCRCMVWNLLRRHA